jgi:hypothetical protein
MKKTRTLLLLKAAAKLPPAKARALVEAIAAKADAPDSPESIDKRVSHAAELMQSAMAETAIAELEQAFPTL